MSSIEGPNSYKSKPMYKFLVILAVATAASHHAWHTLFNNFSVEVAHLDSKGVGLLQSIREIPGLLSFLAIYVLLFMKEHTMATISALLLGLGVAATGFFPSEQGLILTTLIMSFGFHYFETANQSLALQYFTIKEGPFIMADLRKYGALASIVTGGLIWGLSKFLGFTYLYLIFGLIGVIAALWSLNCNPEDKKLPRQHKKMIFRKKYWLFYTLTFLGGARRQIFMVFAVFLMVKEFNFDTSSIAGLFVVNQAVNFFLYPYIAKLIDRYGERPVLMGEYLGLIGIFFAYTFITIPWVIAALYILDNIFYNSSIGIRTYFQKIADAPDIAPTAGVSFTINHIAAVVIPYIGGLLWLEDFRIPFYFGVFLAFMSLILCFLLPRPLTLRDDIAKNS